jgi:predicted CopG family antitoxin
MIWLLYITQLIVCIIAMVQYHKLYKFREENSFADVLTRDNLGDKKNT